MKPEQEFQSYAGQAVADKFTGSVVLPAYLQLIQKGTALN